MTQRLGDWTQTASGRKFWPLDPSPDDVNIDDIAHALSNVCRFGGHSRVFYSVAQHSILVSLYSEPNVAIWGLLHDASEAYVGDMVRPLKHSDGLWVYRAAEQKVQRAICDRFGLPHDMPESVRLADEMLLATEARDIMGGECAGRWNLKHTPGDFIVHPMDPTSARRQFLARFDELTRPVWPSLRTESVA